MTEQEIQFTEIEANGDMRTALQFWKDKAFSLDKKYTRLKGLYAIKHAILQKIQEESETSSESDSYEDEYENLKKKLLKAHSIIKSLGAKYQKCKRDNANLQKKLKKYTELSDNILY
jgi:hypothetical protein